MGVHELPMVGSHVIQYLIVFGIVIITIGSYFSSMTSSLLSSEDAIKGDSIANAMSTVSMHDDSRVSITWDKSNFVIGTTTGALLTIYENGGVSISPYPGVYDFSNSVSEGEFSYLGEGDVSNFSFSNELSERMAIAR